MGVLQCKERRQQEESRHTDSKYREKRCFCEFCKKALKAVPLNNAVRNEDKENENTGKQTHIVVCNERNCKRDCKKSELALCKQFYYPESHKRSNAYGIEPNGVPIVTHKECAE